MRKLILPPRALTLDRIIEIEGMQKVEFNTPGQHIFYAKEPIMFVLSNFKKGVHPREFTTETENNIIFSAGELIDNAAKYGNEYDSSKKIEIYCAWMEREFYTAIKDEGKGFDIEHPEYKGLNPPNGSMGLRLVKKSVDLLYNFKDSAVYFCKRVETRQ